MIGADDSINSDIHKAALARLSEIELNYCLLDVEKEIIIFRKVAVVQNGWVKAAFVILCRTIDTTSTYTIYGRTYSGCSISVPRTVKTGDAPSRTTPRIC